MRILEGKKIPDTQGIQIVFKILHAVEYNDIKTEQVILSRIIVGKLLIAIM